MHRRKTQVKIISVLLLAIFSGCNSDSRKIDSEYKMVSYESKAWVDSINFPVIRFYHNHDFEILKEDKIFNTGKYEQRIDSLYLKLDDGHYLPCLYTDTTRTVLKVARLVNIEVEASSGYFKRIK